MKNIDIKITNKNKIILSIIATLIFVGMVSYFAIFGSLSAIQDTEDKIIINKLDLDKRYADSISQKQFLSKMKLVDSQLKKLDSIYIDKNKLLDFVTNIEGAASNEQVEQAINIKDTPDTTGGPVKTVINLTVRGTFSRVMNFLKDIEALSYYINFTSINIQKTPNGVMANISADAYVK